MTWEAIRRFKAPHGTYFLTVAESDSRDLKKKKTGRGGEGVSDLHSVLTYTK